MTSLQRFIGFQPYHVQSSAITKYAQAPAQPLALTSLLHYIVLTLAQRAASVTKVMFSVAAIAYNVTIVAVSIMAFITLSMSLFGQAPAVKKVNVPSVAPAGLQGRSPASMSLVRRVRCVWRRWVCWVATPRGREYVQSPRTL